MWGSLGEGEPGTERPQKASTVQLGAGLQPGPVGIYAERDLGRRDTSALRLPPLPCFP